MAYGDSTFNRRCSFSGHFPVLGHWGTSRIGWCILVHLWFLFLGVSGLFTRRIPPDRSDMSDINVKRSWKVGSNARWGNDTKRHKKTLGHLGYLGSWHKYINSPIYSGCIHWKCWLVLLVFSLITINPYCSSLSSSAHDDLPPLRSIQSGIQGLGLARYMTNIEIPSIYLGKFHHELTSRANPGNHILSKGKYPQMAELFRLVNYYNLPRSI